MTPMGKVIDLPSGATPIDFAYRIHTDVGHTTVGAIVNDAMVPLNTELHTGDVVKIKTAKNTGPSEDWLKFVKTNQAKSKIKNYLARKETEAKESRVHEGEKMLSEELRKRGFDAKEYMDKKKVEGILKQFRCRDYVDLMYGIAVKSINVTSVCEKLTNKKGRISEDEALSKIINRESKHHNDALGLIVPGVEDMRMSIARCCMPVYGDEIVGFITKGAGVKVHRKDCKNIADLDNRLIDVQWDEGDQDRYYNSDIVVKAHDRSFLLTDIVTIVSQSKAPMESISANVNHETLITTIKLTIRVKNAEQLRVVIANIRKIESVISVERSNH